MDSVHITSANHPSGYMEETDREQEFYNMCVSRFKRAFETIDFDFKDFDWKIHFMLFKSDELGIDFKLIERVYTYKNIGVGNDDKTYFYIIIL